MLLFQNMTYVDHSRPKLPKVKEQIRMDHAQELLGPTYKTSAVQHVEGKQNIQDNIFNKVQSALPEKHKAKAAEITAAIIEESERHGLDPVFTLAVIQTESGFNPNAKGKMGDSGLMQILPDTAKWIAQESDLTWEGKKALFDPVYNIKIGTAYFAHLRSEFHSVPKDYLRAYNSGPKAARKAKPLKTKQATKANKDPKPQLNAHILNKIYARKVMTNYVRLYKSFNQPTQQTWRTQVTSLNTEP